jgi:hypothetical protein
MLMREAVANLAMSGDVVCKWVDERRCARLLLILLCMVV